MFYSKKLLARKGPLGTVWRAAHLQHKLNKSHYIATDIRTTIERILYPEVPIALRMSGYLLLGVVRIYSKQVEYLFQDCNTLLIEIGKSVVSTNVNLPQNAIHATFESVTLPDNFHLDALDLDIDISDRDSDDHVKDLQDITLKDQMLAEQDSYIFVSLSEDLENSPCSRISSILRLQPMQEDNYPDTPAGATTNAQDSGPDDQEIAEMPFKDSASQSYPELEIMRDASLRSENILLWPNQTEDRLEPDLYLVEVMKQKETDTLTLELVPDVSPLQAAQSQEPFCDLSEQCPEILDSNNANSRFTFDSDNAHAANVSPKLTVQPTPPAQQAMQNKKRRHQYDDVTVLSGRSMKEQINDCSGILRKWKEPQKDTLGRWKWHKKIKKDTIFVEPLLTGLCDGLREAYKKDFVSSKPHLSLVEETCPQVAETSSPMDDDNMAIEHPQDLKMPAEDSCIPDSPNISSSSPSSLTSSPAREHNYSTPVYGTGTNSLLDLVETTYGVSSNLEDHTRRLESDNVTPVMLLKDLPGVEETLCTDIAPSGNSGDGELAFLAEDDNISAGPKGTSDDLQRQLGTSEFEDLSARTRAVAHFLKERLSVTPVVQNQSANISLKTILEGKRRKLCARMIYETLVLKNRGLVDVIQEESYGDITLTVTPKLSEELFLT